MVCHKVVFVLYWIMTRYVTAKVSRHEEHPQNLCEESLPVIMIPGPSSPRCAATIQDDFLDFPYH